MKTSTFSFSFLPLILLFFFPLLNTTIAKNLVPQTCKKCAQRDPNLSYKFCTTSLQAVPKSNHADLRELGAISIKLVRHNVTSTKHFIKHLLKRKKLDRFTKACLEDCLELYSDALPTITQALKNYRLKRYADANIKLSSVLDAPVTCEDGFKEKKGLVSPLTTKNNEAFQLSAISLSIINMLSSL